MKIQFIEVTIVADTKDPRALLSKHKGCIRVDQIANVVDVTSGKFQYGAASEITLYEAADYLDEDANEVVHALRTITVTETYEILKQSIDKDLKLVGN